MPDEFRQEVLTSFYRVRQALGYLGLVLPVALVIGGLLTLGGVEPSISDYYYTVLRDIFVGTMFAIAVFLIAYPGHSRRGDERVSDDTITTLAGIAALGMAFLPNEGPGLGDVLTVSQQALGVKLAALGHYLCALTFLGCLAWMCLVKFSRTANPARRRIYRGCGWAILALTVVVVVASVIKIWGSGTPHRIVVDWLIVLWAEALAIWAFSIAWLTKGRADRSLARILHLPKRAGAPVFDDEGPLQN